MRYLLAALLLAGTALPASAAVLVLDGGWQSDNLDEREDFTDNSPWTFTIAAPAHFSLTDCCVAGDVWTLSGDLTGSTTVGAGPADKRADGTFFGVNWLNAALGKYTAYVGPGTYNFSVTGNGGGGFPAGVGLRLDSTIPEPATWAMLISGFGIVGFMARRRRVSALA